MDLTGILQKAIKKIKNNYQHNPAIMEGFYRETVKMSNEDDYFAFAEGVLEMYKAPINNPNDEVRMLKGRKKELPFYFQNDGNTCYVPKITNGPNIGILLDFVKDRRSFLHSFDFYWYKFYLEDITTLDDKVIYAINFKPKNGATFFEGTLFIEKESLAFVRAEYKLTDYGLEKVNNIIPK